MGILSRMKDIMASNINALLDKAENPEKMINQMLRQSMEDLAEVKKETASVIANEKNAYRQMQECQEKVNSYNQAAERAVQAGNDNDALQLIQSKDRVEKQLQGLRENYEAAHKDAENMRAMYNKLNEDIQELQGRAAMIKGKAATAKAREHANKVTAGAGNFASLEAFDRMEAKVQKQLDEADAIASLDDLGEPDEDLLSKYAGGASSSAQDQLAAMKARLGKS